MLIIALWACNGATPPAPSSPPVVPPPTAPEAAEAEAVQPSQRAAPAPDEAVYGNQWVIILSSKREPGHEPPGLAAVLTQPELAATPVRLQSSRFRGLMPCYEIVVARAFSDRAPAVDFSKRLTALGIENYPKHTGDYVGEIPKVEAFCASSRASAASVGGCGAARIVETWADTTFAHLPLDPIESERALLTAGKRKKLSDEAWVAPLTAERLGGHALGDELDQHRWNGEAAGTCTIARFVALTRGVPHFSWFEGSKTEPGCGEPELFMELSCAQRGEVLGVKPMTAGQASADAAALWTSAAALASLTEAATHHAGVELSRSESVSAFGDYHVSEAHLITGEGYDACGGDDLNVTLRGLTGAQGQTLVPFRDVSHTELLGVVELDGQPHLVERGFNGSITFSSSTGDVSCSVHPEFCDCGC